MSGYLFVFAIVVVLAIAISVVTKRDYGKVELLLWGGIFAIFIVLMFVYR